MLNIHNLKHNKEAFTLVEVMLLLVVLSLVFASSVSLITRKHKLKPRRSVHGQYICFRERGTGVLRQVKYSGKSLLQDQSGIDKCTFEAPNNSSYMYIMLVGAGGAGGNANHKPQTSDLYEGPMYIDFLKKLTDGDTDGSNEVAGITEDDVKNDAKWKYEEKDKEGKVTKKVEVPFSVLAFRRILADNHVKIFAYDYAGGGDNSGGMQYDAFTRNDADGDDKANWYRSSCDPIDSTGEIKSAKECLRILITSIKTSDSDKLRRAKENISGHKDICVFREPISRNCPYLHEYFKPYIGVKNSGDEGYHSLVCSGRSGQQGALIFTKERDFDTGISYANGKRYAGAGDNVIDWTYYYLKDYYIHPNTCIVGVSYNSSPQYTPGTFVTFDEAEGSLDKNLYNNGKPFTGVNKDGTKDVTLVQTQFDNGNNIYGTDFLNIYQRIFKTYPSVENLDYKIFTQFGQNHITCEKGRGDDKIAGGDGQNGGLPFFSGGQKGVGIKDKTGWHYEAFSSYKGGSTYTDATAGGKGAKGLEIDDNVFDRTDFTLKQTKCPATSEPTSKNRTLDAFSNMGTTNGFFSCVGRVGFSYYNNSITSSSASAGHYYSWTDDYTGTKDYSGTDKGYVHLLRINPFHVWYWNGLSQSVHSEDRWISYDCPAVQDLRTNNSKNNTIQEVTDRDRAQKNSIGLKISHYISRSVLHHGERGAAGESKTLFARSFGSADITMLPGVEGKAKAIVTDENATDEERTASAGNGGRSLFGIGCQTVEGEGDDPKCDYKLVAKGGAGGAGFVEEDPAFTPLDKENIKDYVEKINNGTATAPDKYSDSYEDGTYEGEDSDFQQIAYLSDFPGTDARDIIKKLGKGGDGGYVHHKCWLQPQYFKYHYNNWYFGYKGDYGKFDKDDYTFDDWIKEHSDWGVDIPNIEGSYNGDSFEGYTAFTEDIIKKIGVCGADDKKPQDQFDEIAGIDGYPGAIVIMW